jgi:pimeloyl-ACP methyl ester carboxylesterase
MKKQLLSLSNGITLDCRMAGVQGRPLMLFLHGFPEAAFVWDEMLDFFSAPEHGGYFCVAPNLRGYAGSSTPADVTAYRAKHLVQDLVALKEQLSPQQPLACLVAHDWGGAVAWNMANQFPETMAKLAIINSPHPGTFLRELQSSPEQQAASAYMNFLIRPDAESLLAEDDYRRLWAFFTNMGAIDGPYAWLTDSVKAQYREVWSQGLTGAAITLPKSMLDILVPTLVLWGMQDIALPPGLIDGLEDYIPDLTLQRVADGSHWLVHEQPAMVAQKLLAFLQKT